jgi:TonB family protein
MAQMMTVRAPLDDLYRLPLWGAPDPRFRRCLQISGGIGLFVLLVALFTPRRAVEITTVEEIPERFARLILEEPKAPAAPPRVVAPTAPEIVMETKPESVPKPKEIPKDVGQRRQTPAPVPQDRGQVGRQKAQQEVASQLTEVKESLSSVLDDVTAALASTDTGAQPTHEPQRRRTRSGRSATQMAGVGAGVPKVDAPVQGSSISGSGAAIAIESIGSVSDGGPSSTSDRSSNGTVGQSEYRSDQSLLAVVRKYSPGIQFCYDNELKKAPGLGGKLVVSITVTPTGRVSDASIVTDSVRSAGLTSCALAQIQSWKFPEIPEGTVTFQAPFIFTPPE